MGTSGIPGAKLLPIVFMSRQSAPVNEDQLRGITTPALAWLTLAVNGIVILQGALVRATGSGAGCGRDWPRCQGEFLPLGHGIATWIEFSHRALSGVALLMGVWLLVRALRLRKANPGLLAWTVASTAFLGIEALIGAATVLTGLTGDNVSVARGLLVAFHLLNSLWLMGSLSLAVYHAGTVRAWPPGWHGQSGLGWLIGLGLLAMMVVMFSGGIAAMGNTMFPPESLEAGLSEDFSAASHPLIRLRILHPLLAIAVGVYLWAIHAITGWLKPVSEAVQWRRLLLWTYAVQLVIGTVNLSLLGPIALQLMHLAAAVGVFCLWTLVAWIVLTAPGPARTPGSLPWRNRAAVSA